MITIRLQRIFYEVQVLADATSWGSSQESFIEEVESVVKSSDFALPFRSLLKIKDQSLLKTKVIRRY
uniref:Uncharacterized protein n=1 Tax=Tanacetum cinerariifolium TaxID=118510 RepID=A0A6L2NXK1_TANCI|nr:hypothetical protein [Tanacetum cinerariifolium]